MPSKQSLTIKFHQSLYVEDAIQQAIDTFEGFATFALHNDGDHFVVDVTEINRDVEGDVVAEFSNFALANSITRGTE